METDELRAQVNSTRQDAVVDAEAELKPDEHDTVKRSMTDKPVGASTDPQVKAVKDGKTKKATALRQTVRQDARARHRHAFCEHTESELRLLIK